MGNALGQPVPDNERLILEADRSQQTLGAFISRAVSIVRHDAVGIGPFCADLSFGDHLSLLILGT